MLVLGLDPGLAITGYGLVRETESGNLEMVDYGAITTPAKDSIPERLLTIDRELGALVARYHPDVVAIEELFFCKNVTTALIVGQADRIAGAVGIGEPKLDAGLEVAGRGGVEHVVGGGEDDLGAVGGPVGEMSAGTTHMAGG